MVKLYKRTIELVQKVAELDCDTCPDQDAMESLILEAREILNEINKI
jgi:hypothetical protein